MGPRLRLFLCLLTLTLLTRADPSLASLEDGYPGLFSFRSPPETRVPSSSMRGAHCRWAYRSDSPCISIVCYC